MSDFKIMARIGGMDKSQIIAYLQNKGYAPTQRWDDLWQEAHNYAKTIAGETKLDVLIDVFSHIENSLQTGETRQKTAVKIAEALAKKGWYFAHRGGSAKIDYKGILGALLPLSDEDKQALEQRIIKGSIRRLKLIVRQNTQTAFMAGAYKTQVENIKYRPYWRYIGINDQSIRDSHRALHYKIYRADDPIWDIIYPPNGFNCRCKVSALSERDMKRRGFSVDSASVKKAFIEKDKYGNDRYRYQVTTGKHSEYIDDGFGYNPGKALTQSRKRFNAKKAQLAKLLDISETQLRERPEGSKVSPMINQHRTPWADDFPDTVIDRALGDATQHSLYEKAKAGDTTSAYLLAKDLVTDEAIEKIRQLTSDKNMLIVPVHAEEAVGKNKIPVAVSAILAEALDVAFSTDIVQATKVSRTAKDGWYRLANPPMFEGKLPKNSRVLLVDDTQTQGGTFAALKGHIESQGGQVIGAYALTGKQYSVQLRLSKETLESLRHEYSNIEPWWRDTFGYGFETLTEWEARYIIKSGKTADEVRSTILERRLKTGG